MRLSDAPAVATSCGRVVRLLTDWFGGAFERVSEPDAFCVFQAAGGQPSDLRVVLVSHIDEIGGCALGPAPGGDGVLARWWGTGPDAFAAAELQAWDYLDAAGDPFPVRAEAGAAGDRPFLVLRGDGVRPCRTAFTFRRSAAVEGDRITGKALDPRATAFAVASVVREMNDPRVGAVFVMAEECAMDVARKAVTWLTRRAPNLAVVINADVPDTANLSEARLDLPAIRPFEGAQLIDPNYGIALVDRLQAASVQVALAAARTGSQTALFAPIARTVSVALPAEGVHTPDTRMSLTGVERCIALLHAVARDALAG